jgi:8-oxo-dGTP diphosphatase
MIQRIAMKALIVRDGKVLLLREAATYDEGTQRGRYHLPGGRVEVGEPFDVALRREVKEETGLEVEIDKPVYVGEWHPVIRGEENQIIAVFFLCTPTTHDITLSSEHDRYVWADPASYEEDVMDPEDKVLATYAKMI